MQITTVRSLNKFIQKIVITIILGSLLSCGNGVPSHILAPPKMSHTLFNVMQHDEFVSNFVLKDTTLNALQMRIAAYKTALDSSQCSAETFEQSLQWYQKNPVIFKVVLDSINKLINFKRNQGYINPTPVNTDATAPIPSQIGTPKNKVLRRVILDKNNRRLADTTIRDEAL
jgi:hypothetical protein